MPLRPQHCTSVLIYFSNTSHSTIIQQTFKGAAACPSRHESAAGKRTLAVVPGHGVLDSVTHVLHTQCKSRDWYPRCTSRSRISNHRWRRGETYVYCQNVYFYVTTGAVVGETSDGSRIGAGFSYRRHQPSAAPVLWSQMMARHPESVPKRTPV